jgi:hypothetical protein
MITGIPQHGGYRQGIETQVALIARMASLRGVGLPLAPHASQVVIGSRKQHGTGWVAPICHMEIRQQPTCVRETV